MAQSMTNDRIDLPEKPDVAGLVFRQVRGEADFAAIANVINACGPGDGVEMPATAEAVAYSFAHPGRSDPGTDRIIVEVDGALIGYGKVNWEREANGTWIYQHVGWVLPVWQRRDIGGAMLGWQEKRLREIATGHTAPGERCFESWASEAPDQAARKMLLVTHGYTPQRFEADMLRDLENIPDATLPDGIEVRPVLTEHLRAIFEAENEAQGASGAHADTLDAEFEKFANDPLNELSLWRVAWDGDQVVGMVRNHIDHDENREFKRKRGWTEHISVRQAWRRMGIARALLCRSLHILREHGMTEAALGVNTQNPHQAFRLYEDVGFRRIALFAFYRKPVEMEQRND
jgi:mycothiol synthase